MINTEAFDRAIVRICGADGFTKGTGFFVKDSGLILTCDHVIGESSQVYVQTCDKKIHQALTIERFSTFDLALVSIDLTDTITLPIDYYIHKIGSRVWTKGFQYHEVGLTSPFPVRSTISDTTAITYKAYSHEYKVANVIVMETGDMNEGLSGAPLIDEVTGVVVGIVNAKFFQRGGFALPFTKDFTLKS